MKIYYKVLDINEEDHAIMVRYYTDLITELSLATEFNPDGSVKLDDQGSPTRCRTDYNISIYDVANPTSNDVVEIINRNAPRQWFQTQEQVKTANTSLAGIQTLKNVVGELADLPTDGGVQQLSDAEIDAILANLTSSTANT